MTALTPHEPATVAPTGCCAPFDPATWQERDITWQDHLFVKQHVTSAFHIPLNMGRKIVSAKTRIDAAGASPAHPLMLTDDTSRWGSELLIEVTAPVPGLTTARLSGRFLTKVYDGPFRDAPKWMADMRRYVESQGHRAGKLYLAYTTCPACAKAYGHNYVVVFAQIAAAS